MFKGGNGSKTREVNGLLDKGCSFEGKLTFDGTIQVNGNFQGEICSDGTLIIGNDAHVEAKVTVDSLVVYGSLRGEIAAKSNVELHVPAVVIADVKTRTLSIEEGVVFQGRCQMDRPEMNKSLEKMSEKGESESVFVM